jgi:hypothetical protein
MDANKRSEMNNQTNNGANEKWTPGSKGNTTSGPLDHTYPQGATQQQGQQDSSAMGTQQSGMGPGAQEGGAFERDSGNRAGLPGGSMQTQQTGGTGPTQGITDSHQRQMEQRSGAYGELEQPVGERPARQGTPLGNHPENRQASTQATQQMNPQNAAQPELQGGSLGRHHGNAQSGTEGGGMAGPQGAQQPGRRSGSMGSQQSATGAGNQGGGMPGPQSGAASEQGGAGSTSVDRQGSQTGSQGRETGAGVHQSNDVAGGLPRSPGNSGPKSDNPGWLPGASVQQERNGVHQSNDAAGGLPKSPAGANKLAGDQKMDDDTGFSRNG